LSILRCSEVGYKRILRTRSSGVSTNSLFGFLTFAKVGIVVSESTFRRFVGCSVVVGAATLLRFVAPHAVESRPEDGDDGAEIGAKLLFGRAICRIEHHDSASETFDVPLNEVEGKAAQSVFVGNHNLLDASSADGVHEAKEAGSLEIESRSHVSNHEVVGKAFS